MWHDADKILPLKKNMIHVWKTSVEQNLSNQVAFLTVLSDDEKIRADKFRFKKDELNYITAKGVLRYLLGYYLQISPEEISFEYGDQKKPFVQNELSLKFNVSHSDGMILLGFTLENEIGIDVEYNKRPIEIREISANFFSENETKKLLGLPENEQLKAFYNCWTRKEAFIKAKGGGLSIPLDQFEVSLLPTEKPQLRSINWSNDDVDNWNMEIFDCGKDFTSAAIVNRKISDFQSFAWDWNSLKNFNQ